MFELLTALSVLVVGVVVLTRRRRAQSVRPSTPSPTRLGDSVGGGAVDPEERSATTATADADVPSASTAPTLLSQHEAEAAPDAESRDSTEPQTGSPAVKTTGGANDEPEAAPLPVERPSSESESHVNDDRDDRGPEGDQRSDDDALIPVFGETSLDVGQIATDGPGFDIGEPQAQAPIVQAEIEPLPFEAPPDEVVSVSADEGEGESSSANEIAPADLTMDLPFGGDPDTIDAIEGEEGESDPDIDGGPEGEADAVEPEGAPRRYRPAPRLPRPAQPGAPKARDLAARDRSLQMAFRLSFRAGGVCQFSLLAQRASDLPEQIEVRGRDRTEQLRALQEDWYELKAPADIGGLLRAGVAWTTERSADVAAKWMLSPREIYVLGAVTDFGGYVSTTSRLIIGEEHIVLCVAGRRDEVSAALTAAGCVDFRLVEAASGIPDGWIAYRGVKPSHWVSTTDDGDILDTLRPLANIDIQLEGGIQVDRSSWLVGHAPTIRIRGDLASAENVLIDDQSAVIANDGTCTSPGQASLGEHIVWSAAASRSYRVIDGKQEWAPWSAHRAVNGTICGAAVFPLPGSQLTARQVVVPSRDVSLIGATPGAVHHCSPVVGSRSAVNIVFPSFDPVWIIPRFPLRCDRRAARVTRISIGLPSPGSVRSKPRGDRESHREWSRLILDAHRRKLISDPADDATVELWSAYERVARSIWRRLK
jgi:hypothetical protein